LRLRGGSSNHQCRDEDQLFHFQPLPWFCLVDPTTMT
jgi:hypothetical protein